MTPWILLAQLAHGQLVMQFPTGRTSGFMAAFGAKLTDRITWQLVQPEDEFGCNGTDKLTGAALIVRRGGCTFAAKAAFADALSATALIVVDNAGATDALIMSGNGSNYTFPIIGVSYRKSVFSEGAPDSCTAWVYVPLPLDPSEIILVLFATSLVALGAYYSTSDLHKSPLVSPSSEVILVDGWFPVVFVVIGSAALLFMFFFMQYAIYFLLAFFCIGGVSSFHHLLEPLVRNFAPCSRTTIARDIRRSDILAAVPSIVLIVLFVRYRNDDQLGWIFQDTIAIGFISGIQKALRLPSIKIASILLVLLFFFDIFWVFISPALFHKSVMVEVAKGGGTGESVPMVLKIPSMLDDLPSQRMLGFGDVAFPGLLVSYLLRHDMQSKRSRCRGYFWPVLLAYAAGLVMTLFALKISGMGQPALLYLVPSTLGTTMVLGYARRDFRNLWSGLTSSSAEEELQPLEQALPLSGASSDEGTKRD